MYKQGHVTKFLCFLDKATVTSQFGFNHSEYKYMYIQ